MDIGVSIVSLYTTNSTSPGDTESFIETKLQ